MTAQFISTALQMMDGGAYSGLMCLIQVLRKVCPPIIASCIDLHLLHTWLLILSRFHLTVVFLDMKRLDMCMTVLDSRLSYETGCSIVEVRDLRSLEENPVSNLTLNSSYCLTIAEAERITPPGVHAFTPAASRSGKWIAVATRRTSIRHIEIFDLQEKKFLPLTALINPNTHHYSPFVSPSSNKIGYHRCRGVDQGAQNTEPRVEYVKSPLAGVSLVRIRGSFGVISPDGSLIAYVGSCKNTECLAVMKLDGSEKRIAYKGELFGTAWDPTGKGTVYVGQGRGFASVTSTVHIVAISNADTADIEVDEASSSYKYLTKEGTGNNAFPSPSPDGKYVVFRSGRSGHNNLYIMDAAEGEEKYLRQLTEGPWTDTMPNWSPDNEWIVFSSTRLHPTGT